jgi:hypothetical protein
MFRRTKSALLRFTLVRFWGVKGVVFLASGYLFHLWNLWRPYVVGNKRVKIWCIGLGVIHLKKKQKNYFWVSKIFEKIFGCSKLFNLTNVQNRAQILCILVYIKMTNRVDLCMYIFKSNFFIRFYCFCVAHNTKNFLLPPATNTWHNVFGHFLVSKYILLKTCISDLSSHLQA